MEINVDATVEVYKLIHKLNPGKYQLEPKEFEVKVKNYLEVGISIKVEEGVLDIKKKFKMFKMLESQKG